MTNTPPISCIIPNYNGRHLLATHLASILEALNKNDEVLICDDASTDDSVLWLVKHFNLKKTTAIQARNVSKEYSFSDNETIQWIGEYKGIKIIVLAQKRNERFGKTVNTAVAYSSTAAFFLCNTDVSVDREAITILRSQIFSDSSIFAIGALEYEDTTLGEKSGKNKLWFEKGIFQHAKSKDFKPGNTAWASGGSSVFSTDKWLALDGFDPAFYPAYWEDIDISFRARKRGWKVLFNPEAVVYHKHESTNKTVFESKLNKISWKNANIFAWKHATILQKLQILFWYPYWVVQRVKARY